ncbi:DEAD/DEAH box helicase [Brevibacterium epidermidis]|uniref:DEAD/DEAH box helicase n=1 Tax=Brevibacterium epidermidis TaxID=1698 RepID=UPI000DEEA777|nr:DEAD/DEAH box helicase family protein [Brevibacterium epidermidis]
MKSDAPNSTSEPNESRSVLSSFVDDLTEFQKASANHVIDRFYGKANAQRFLIADETGLGKTRVARGVIAQAIEELSHHDDVGRIDIVYVCSNADLAHQNLKRLNVMGGSDAAFSSRLTMLAEHSKRFDATENRINGKAVNFVSFTPGTSFDPGLRTGSGPERAMLYVALDELIGFSEDQAEAALDFFQVTIRDQSTFERLVKTRRENLGEGIDPAILDAFDDAISEDDADVTNSMQNRFVDFLDRLISGEDLADFKDDAYRLIGQLRRALAAASVESLEPDLVILDEFQRFKELLDPETEEGELAHNLFNYNGGTAKVLLLSATPYKPFSLAEESESHASGLFSTLEFLAEGCSDADLGRIRGLLADYRMTVQSGSTDDSITRELSDQLTRLMTRNERPELKDGQMRIPKVEEAKEVFADDIVEYVNIKAIEKAISEPGDRNLFNTTYWKSTPYFLNFSGGYRLGDRLADYASEPDVRRLLKSANTLNSKNIRKFARAGMGNARLRALSRQTLEKDWWKLLWMPPSLPYLKPAGAYSRIDGGITKRVVFSSWNSTPAAVSSLLSYEAERRMVSGTDFDENTAEARRRVSTHFQYRMQNEAPTGMPTLAMFWPMPGIAQLADPRNLIAEHDGSPLSQGKATTIAADRILRHVESQQAELGDDTAAVSSRPQLWNLAFSLQSTWPVANSDRDELIRQISTADRSDHADDAESEAASKEDSSVLMKHLETAEAQRGNRVTMTKRLNRHLAHLALYSPANIAFRVLARLSDSDPLQPNSGLVRAAFVLANGLRSLFNRPDVTKLIEKLDRAKKKSYQQKVLTYCANGNLEAVLDEYLHSLAAEENPQDDEAQRLFNIASTASKALTIKGARLQAADLDNPGDTISFTPRFALRYGRTTATKEDARLPDIRDAFNSPFWPFILASTSVGQEGIDFHRWCHAIFHWNVPSNPVDFEQREGRIDRYRGHAVRKNVANRHGKSALSEQQGHPWDRLYAMATDFKHEFGDFTPGWVYPGEAKIESHVAPIALSTDASEYQRIKRDVALYRLTFGQPRQEDMLTVMRKNGLDEDSHSIGRMRLDLRPPAKQDMHRPGSY